MKILLEKLYRHESLSAKEAEAMITQIATGAHHDYHVASFMTVFNMRAITLEELTGFRNGLMNLCSAINLDGTRTIDVCGTGGDGLNTFNISTLTSLVIAACGVPVTKHGNYGVSSVSGSSNILEYLNVKFPDSPDQVKQQLEQCNIGFIHAPIFHPAMKTVAPIRKALGVKTFFNMLGPLVNPAQPAVQYTGVFSLELARSYNYIFQKDSSDYTIIHSFDGGDEITLTSPFKLFNRSGEYVYTPEQLGYTPISISQLQGGQSIAEAASIFIAILNGTGTRAQNDAVIINSAFALHTYYPDKPLHHCIALAQDALFNKKGLATLKKLQNT